MLPEEWEGKRKRRQAGPVDSVVVALTGRRTVSGRNGSSALQYQVKGSPTPILFWHTLMTWNINLMPC
jgi:hypothetical protein